MATTSTVSKSTPAEPTRAVEEVNPPVMSDELCEHYRAHSEALFQNTDFAIVAPMGPPYELFYGLGTGGFESWMMSLAAEPDYVNAAVREARRRLDRESADGSLRRSETACRSFSSTMTLEPKRHRSSP